MTTPEPYRPVDERRDSDNAAALSLSRSELRLMVHDRLAARDRDQS